MRCKIIPAASALALILALTACAGGETRRPADFKRQVAAPSLEVPPDLTRPREDHTMDLPLLQGEPKVMPRLDGVSVARHGGDRWLVTKAGADELWPKLRDFWRELGIKLERDEPRYGIMETAWAENRADIPEGFLRGLITSVFEGAYSAPTRDRFRMRVERRGDGGSEVFLTHYGVEEVVHEEATLWQPRPSDRELANELLNRLMVFLGVDSAKAKQLMQAAVAPSQNRTELRLDGSAPVLLINESFPRAWRRTGIALDRLGLVVNDRDRSRGVYFVTHLNILKQAGVEEQKGWFSNLFSGKEAVPEERQYRIALKQRGKRTALTVEEENGSRTDARTARRILENLQDELK